jgi:hypothetical protein
MKSSYTIVDPYPGATVAAGFPMLSRLINERVELMDVQFFEELGENDILFIDSGHTVRTGSDVNFPDPGRPAPARSRGDHPFSRHSASL